jgi:hypothetical protein
MSTFWSPVVHGLTPYLPGEQPKLANLIKLNTNDQCSNRSRLRKLSIIVRYFRQPRIDQYLRITAGTDEECMILVNALKMILGWND